MRLVSTFFIALLIVGSPQARAQSVSSLPSADVSSVLDAYEEVYGFSGVALVIDQDSLRHEEARGQAVRGFAVPNRMNVRFPINSVSKTFAAAAALALVADGILDLHAPVATYLPDIDAAWADQVTAHHLLSHTSGLPREYEVAAWESVSLAEQAQRVNRLSLRFDPGAQYGYSNAGYALLGYLIQEIAGRSYPAFLRARILEPVGLDDTGFLINQQVVQRLAHPYAMSPDGIVQPERGKHRGVNPGGGLYSTAEDLYKWTQALTDQTVLPDSLQSLLFAAHVEENGPNNLAGYGWGLKRSGDTLYRVAAGSGTGTKTAIVHDPERGLFIAVMANWAHVPILDLLRDLLFTAIEVPVKLPDAAGLARPADYADVLGSYTFAPGQLASSLGVEADTITLLEGNGHVYLTAPGTSAELLRTMDDGQLALSYTDELTISFDEDAPGTEPVALIRINGAELKGTRVLEN